MNVYRKQSLHRFNRESGFTIGEVLIGIAITSLLFMALTASLSEFSKQQSRLSSRWSSLNASLNLKRILANDSALMNTLFNTGNTVFDCLRDPSLHPLQGGDALPAGCSNQSGTLNKLISSSGQVLVDLSDPTAGFTSAGEPCVGYGTDPICVIRAKIDVKFVCDQVSGSSCLKPQISFTASLEMMSDGPGTAPVQMNNLFEVRKDWSAVTTNLVELTQSPQSGGSGMKSFKLVIIVDNSTSMATYQQKLSDSLSPMLDSLALNNFDLAVQIFTTSQFIMLAKNAYTYALPVNSAQQILQLNSVSCSDGVNTKSGYCIDLFMSGFQKEIWQLKDPVQMTLPSNATSAQFSAFKSTILTTVKNMGVSGSDDEQGLCTLSRLLTNGNSFLSAGDKLGVIVISNEEDHSSTRTCATEINRKYKPMGRKNWVVQPICDGSSTIVPPTDSSQYIMKAKAGAAGYIVHYKCQNYRDGQFVPYNPNDPSTFTEDQTFVNQSYANTPSVDSVLYQSGIDISKSCQQSGLNFTGSSSFFNFGDREIMQTASCPSNVAAKISNMWDCGTRVNGTFIPGQVAFCEVACNDTLNYAPVTMTQTSNGSEHEVRQNDNLSTNYCSSSFDLATPTTDLIEDKYQDTYNPVVSGSGYANMAALFTLNNPLLTPWTPSTSTQGNCCRTQQYHTPFPADDSENIYKSVFEPYALTTQAIDDALINRANTLFGADGYFISSIIHTSDPAKACPMGGDESTGTKFEALAGKIQNSAIVPICAPDYTPALDPLKKFIQSSVSTILAGNDIITLNQGEQIVQLYVSSGGTEAQQYPVGGPNGVWPTILSVSTDSTTKTYRLDFSKTGHTLASTDRVWALVAKQNNDLSIGTIGGMNLSFDDLRSLYHIGLGH